MPSSSSCAPSAVTVARAISSPSHPDHIAALIAAAAWARAIGEQPPTFANGSTTIH